jgi:flagellar L-ring protein precursor FlgH
MMTLSFRAVAMNRLYRRLQARSWADTGRSDAQQLRLMYLSYCVATLALVLLTSGCDAADRLSNIGRPPALSSVNNPLEQPGYKPLSMPMPEQVAINRQPNSLWAGGARSFFKDQRAGRVGDILTVTINIKDQAKLDNSTERNRSDTSSSTLNELYLLHNQIKALSGLLPDGGKAQPPAGKGNLSDIAGASKYKGDGKIDRSEDIQLKVAAVINQILPNGNLVIAGRQEIRVNYELRALQISGVVRPEDITPSNTISSEKIAEARVSYGGQGQVTEVQQPRYGSQVIDILSPF